jgi:hypothetical protein
LAALEGSPLTAGRSAPHCAAAAVTHRPASTKLRRRAVERSTTADDLATATRHKPIPLMAGGRPGRVLFRCDLPHSAPRTGHTQISRGRCSRRAARRAERHLAKDFEASSLLPLAELDRVGEAMSLLQSLGDEPLATDTERPAQRSKRASEGGFGTPRPAPERRRARDPRVPGPVEPPRRCPWNHEGRSAPAVASGPERDSSTPEAATAKS